MTYLFIFCLMILFHIIDDFVLQTFSLSKLKQKNFWITECKKLNIDINNYKYDYLVALLTHALSWSIMVHLPVLWYFKNLEIDSFIVILISCSIFLHFIIHGFIDNLKANKYQISLLFDQTVHLFQVILIFLTFCLFSFS